MHRVHEPIIGVVRMAATSDCASTWPPKTRPSGIHWLGPVKMSSLVRAPVSVRSSAARNPSSGLAADEGGWSDVGSVTEFLPVRFGWHRSVALAPVGILEVT